MCGIVGYTATPEAIAKGGTSAYAASTLVNGLRALEYRGYDSAGICLADAKRLHTFKAVGRVADLDKAVPGSVQTNPALIAGIAHTRWATHGGISVENAHPHLSADGTIAVVHNGIIDNADELRTKLETLGFKFVSETDTEVLAHLIQFMGMTEAHHRSLATIVRHALYRVKGTYGIAVMFAGHPDEIVVAKMGSPLVVGIGEDASYIASDVSPIVRYTNRVVYLDDGDIMTVRPGSVECTTKAPLVQTVDVVDNLADVGDYDSYMLKEIFEQPAAIKRCFGGRIRDNTCVLGGFNMAQGISDVTSVTIIGCGTSYHAGLLGASLVEKFAGIPCRVEIASEYSSKPLIRDKTGIYLAISQSGETFDTIECIKELKGKGCDVYGIVNTVGSSIARLCGKGVYIHAGPEIAVASTKAFTSQVAALAMFAIMLGRATNIDVAEGEQLCSALRAVPDRVSERLDYFTRGKGLEEIKRASETLAGARYALFLGRGVSYPVALEGALKLKEIAYVPCEAYPAGEMKHGPIAMIEKGTPVICIVPNDAHQTKMVANIKEVEARGAQIIPILYGGNDFSAFETVIPLQLLAYYTAKYKGLDVDRPRNLAKSVTVG
jgi:glucosamine--fructose-6-phosphate aminotransferase (isomerizing)